jgi:hypothetical protein
VFRILIRIGSEFNSRQAKNVPKKGKSLKIFMFADLNVLCRGLRRKIYDGF